MSARRLLFISYYFPPDGGAGTQRAAKFCKYLPEHGWKIYVITREGPGGRWAPPDPSLARDIPQDIEVMRVAGDSGGLGWAEAAARAAASLCREQRIDIVLATMSPFSLGLPARRLESVSGVPVVFDLRDPWTLDGWPAYRSWFEWHRDRRSMKLSLGGAAGVIANTTEAGRCIAQVLSSHPPRHLTVIPNGFDGADFAGPAPPVADPSRFTLVATGTLFADVIYPKGDIAEAVKRRIRYRPERIFPDGRTPYYLLRALRDLRSSGAADKVRLVLVGTADDAVYRLVRESGVADMIELTGYLPHFEAVQWLRRADALFLPLHDVAPGARARIVPGKTYEYLASGRPILACLPPGDARDLVAQSDLAFVALPRDASAIATALNRMLELWRSGSLPQGAAPWVAAFERRALASRLSTFLQEVLVTRAAAGEVR